MDEQPAVGQSINEEADSDRWPEWPRCPACGTRRQTFCRTCDLAGDDFGLAEFIPSSDPIDAPVDGVVAKDDGPDSSHDCCGGSSCDSAGGESRENQRGEKSRGGACCGSPIPDESPVPDELPVLLFCPDCSEAFSPSYFRLCARCGHDFGEGREVQGPQQAEMNNRVLVAILVLAGLAIASMIYFWILFR